MIVNFDIREIQYGSKSIITTGKHSSLFLVKHCDKSFDHRFNSIRGSEELFSDEGREYIFLIREPIDRFMSGLLHEWVGCVKPFFKGFDIPYTHKNIVKSINYHFIYLLLDSSLFSHSFHVGNWVELACFSKFINAAPNINFVNYEDRVKLYKRLNIDKEPPVNVSPDKFKIYFNDLSNETQNKINIYLKNELKYYNYIFQR